jgi:hypothetical protein
MDAATIVTSWKFVLVISNPVPMLWRSDQSTLMNLCIIVSYTINALVLPERGNLLDVLISQPRAV